MNERGEQWARREEEEYKDKRGNNWVEGVNNYVFGFGLSTRGERKRKYYDE
jgi:hypothetical protein